MQISNHLEIIFEIKYISTIPALSPWSNIAMGIPTFFDLPQTTAFLPKVGIPRYFYFKYKIRKQSVLNVLLVVLPVRRINSWTPNGVHGPKHCISKQNLPIFTMLKPSTSLCGATALHIARSVMCSGSGN